MFKRHLFSAILFATACVQPTEDAAVDEAANEAAEAPPEAERAPTVAALAPGSAELSAEEVAAFDSVEEAIANYRGPRVFVVPTVDRVEGGVPFVVSARLEDADGAGIELDDAMAFTWAVPDGWQVEGEGAEVTVTPSDALPPGDAPIDVRVSVERGGARLVRGGVSLSR